MGIGDTFKLIGRANIFTVTKLYNAAGAIPSVVGVCNIRGKVYQTCARLADVEAQ